MGYNSPNNTHINPTPCIVQLAPINYIVLISAEIDSWVNTYNVFIFNHTVHTLQIIIKS